MYQLYIGDKNYSSWSLRPWVLMTALGIPFAARDVRVAGSGPNLVHRGYSDNGLVPCLHDDGFRVWDTLAIFEYLHERHAGVWPSDQLARARARSVSAEMHSGFAAVRAAMPMNIKLKLVGREPDGAVAEDVQRIATIWNECRQNWGAADSPNPFLFGEFCAADAMFAPIVWRFETYNVVLEGAAADYQQAMLAMSAMRQWEVAALAEGRVMPYDDIAAEFGGKRNV